jgi:hypothetical protein
LPFSGLDESVFGWEKVLQIADMALYLGKANGRNRAYGIAVWCPSEAALPCWKRIWLRRLRMAWWIDRSTDLPVLKQPASPSLNHTDAA